MAARRECRSWRWRGWSSRERSLDDRVDASQPVRRDRGAARADRRGRAGGGRCWLDEEETRKHASLGLEPGPGVQLDAPVLDDVELCVLGGDGTILALGRYAGTSVPVFAVKLGEIGFLATVEPEELHEGIARALSEVELLQLPAIVLDAPDDDAGEAERGAGAEINDVAMFRQGRRARRRDRVCVGGHRRQRALRRPRDRNARGLDRLQPRQRQIEVFFKITLVAVLHGIKLQRFNDAQAGELVQCRIGGRQAQAFLSLLCFLMHGTGPGMETPLFDKHLDDGQPLRGKLQPLRFQLSRY